jgi:hypothetical protein
MPMPMPMPMPNNSLRSGVLILLLTLLSSLAEAVTVDDLQASGRLEIKAWVQPETGVVPGQKVSLFVEVATDRWFSDGTRVAVPEVRGLVILQTEKFASNASELRGGQNWVVQRWTLDVYPQQPGAFGIPPFAVSVSVSHEDAGDVRGNLMTPPVRLVADLPDALADLEHWVAAPDYRITQSFNRSLEGLEVGDAFEREIVFEATDSMAMMLPAFEPESPQGLAAYPSPPKLDNQSNRGAVSARRVERVTYVVEAPGDYQLPGREYFWWNTDRRRLELLDLPATEIRAGGDPVASEPESESPASRQWWTFVTLLGTALLLLLLLKLLNTWQLPPLEFWLTPWRRLQGWWRELRRPALPAALNPDSSAAD